MKKGMFLLLGVLIVISGCAGVYVHDDMAASNKDKLVGLGTFGGDETFMHTDGSCLKIYRTSTNRFLEFFSLDLIKFYHADVEQKCR